MASSHFFVEWNPCTVGAVHFIDLWETWGNGNYRPQHCLPIGMPINNFHEKKICKSFPLFGFDTPKLSKISHQNLKTDEFGTPKLQFLSSTTNIFSFLLLLKESHGCMSFGWCMATCHEYLWGGIEWWTSTRAKEAWQKNTTKQTGQVGGFKYLLIFFIFIPTWGNDPIWLISFKWVEAIKQMGKTKSLNRGNRTREPPSEWISSHKLSQVVWWICGMSWHFFLGW